MQIHIFGSIAKGMESNQKLIPIIKYYNVQYTLGILYHTRSVHFYTFEFPINA